MKTLRLAAIASTLVLAACGVGTAEVTEDLELTDNSAELTASSKFETFQGRDGQYYFHLVAGNGERVLQSEGYTTLYSAKNGINTVKSNGAIESRYLLREASDGAWYFVLVGGNGQIIGVSQMYATKYNAERGMTTVRTVLAATTALAPAVTNDPRFQFFRGTDGKYYFHVRAANGEIVLQSQGYTYASSARNGAASVQSNGMYQERYEIRAAADGKFYFVLKAGNGQVIGRGETYATQYNAERGAKDCAALFVTTLPR